TDAVLAAAGHATGVGSRSSRPERPGGLTKREVEVLRLAAQGLTTAAIAERLYISPKTTDHHIQPVYTKIGVSTRAAAALWAMQHDLVNGWFHTGDGVYRDENDRYHFVDRIKDSMRRRGENISSMELEAYVVDHPAVAECAVIAVPSARAHGAYRSSELAF